MKCRDGRIVFCLMLERQQLEQSSQLTCMNTRHEQKINHCGLSPYSLTWLSLNDSEIGYQVLELCHTVNLNRTQIRSICLLFGWQSVKKLLLQAGKLVTFVIKSQFMKPVVAMIYKANKYLMNLGVLGEEIGKRSVSMLLELIEVACGKALQNKISTTSTGWLASKNQKG